MSSDTEHRFLRPYKACIETFPELEQRELSRLGLTEKQISELERAVALYVAWRDEDATAPRRKEAQERWNRIADAATELADELGSIETHRVTWEQWKQASYELLGTNDGERMNLQTRVLGELRLIAETARRANVRANAEMPRTKPPLNALRELVRRVKYMTAHNAPDVLEICLRLAGEPERDIRPLLRAEKN